MGDLTLTYLTDCYKEVSKASPQYSKHSLTMSAGSWRRARGSGIHQERARSWDGIRLYTVGECARIIQSVRLDGLLGTWNPVAYSADGYLGQRHQKAHSAAIRKDGRSAAASAIILSGVHNPDTASAQCCHWCQVVIWMAQRPKRHVFQHQFSVEEACGCGGTVLDEELSIAGGVCISIHHAAVLRGLIVPLV